MFISRLFSPNGVGYNEFERPWKEEVSARLEELRLYFPGGTV
jgi:hypothetical protein